ncbi:hypothetical protein [Actinoplanes xinjiangensis]|uniref:hypothetical protein n=1 Tax=Actinoplanes xinjiangensis TaxID=512350 RepID=UPI000D6B417D|nr:hypothetical protein [Actinoplanes xinjiangensis]GIF43984.1 hypothetical protein Axi01nite_82950 [Actinoplanes xinjiangensis]
MAAPARRVRLRDGRRDRFELPSEHALALSVVDSPAYLVAAGEIITGYFLSLEHLEAAFRSDGGLPGDEVPGCTYHGIERYFRTAYVNQLAQVWFPAVPGLVEMAVEPWAADDWTGTIGMPITRIGYASPTALCTPGSLAQPGAYGPGTLGGPAQRLELLARAGFADPVLAADTGFNLVVVATKP